MRRGTEQTPSRSMVIGAATEGPTFTLNWTTGATLALICGSAASQLSRHHLP